MKLINEYTNKLILLCFIIHGVLLFLSYNIQQKFFYLQCCAALLTLSFITLYCMFYQEFLCLCLEKTEETNKKADKLGQKIAIVQNCMVYFPLICIFMTILILGAKYVL